MSNRTFENIFISFVALILFPLAWYFNEGILQCLFGRDSLTRYNNADGSMESFYMLIVEYAIFFLLMKLSDRWIL
jgi:hypothetical protein